MDDAQDLIDRLLTLAGIIMEDASAVALVIENGGDRTARIAATAQAAGDVSALTMAAEVALRRLANDWPAPMATTAQDQQA